MRRSLNRFDNIKSVIFITNFQRKQDFYEHNNNEHADIVCEIWEGCPKCHKYYPNRLALNKHKLRHQQNRHKAAPGIHHDDLGGPEKCEFCQRTFGKKAQYYTHVNKVHVDVICKSWTKCEKCQKFFPSKRIRDRHLNGFKKRGESCSPKYNQDFGDHLDGILVDSDNFGVEEDSGLGGPHFLATHCKVARSSLAIKSSSCVFCGLELYRREDLFEHVNNEHKEEISNSWLPCNDCQKFFPTRTALITHAATHDIDNFKEDIDILENSNGSLTCTFCKLVLTRKQDLYEHANKEHLSDIALIWKKCKDCDRHYPTRKALNNHEDSHRRRVASGDDDVLGRGQSCEYCDQYFSRRDQYYKHVNEDHKSEISSFWISCFDCHRYFPTKRVRDRHRERFRKRKESCIPKYALPQEDEEVDESQIMAEFSTEDSVQKDSLLPPQPTDDHPFLTCPFCKLVLPRKQDYYDHANREHVDDIDLIWFGCKQCLRYYPTKKSLNNHEEKSHRRKGPGEEETILKAESCMFCNEQFARREQVYRHVNDEHLDKIKNSWKQCADCLKYFPTKRVHDRHRDKFRSRGELCIPKYANSSGEVRYKITHIPRNPDKPGLTCPFCMLIMQREQDFYDHANRKHYEEIESLWEKCFYCSKFYPTKKSLYKHKRICYKGPPDKSSSTNPAGSTKEVCEFCPETFTRKVLYYDHVDSVHKTEAEQKWVSCDTCFRYFPTKWVCDQHKLGFRERGESCGPGNQTSEFDVEEDVVEDDNYEYFDCDFCDMSFSIEEEYHSHAQQIHSSEVKKVWIGCASCQKYFPTPESYHLHLTECQADSKQKALKSPSVTISKLQPLKPELPPPPPLMPRPPSLFMQSQLMNLVQRQGRLNCTFCLQVFGKEQHYYRHVNDAHHDEASEVWATCDGCNK